jgi:hypothetical protein
VASSALSSPAESPELAVRLRDLGRGFAETAFEGRYPEDPHPEELPQSAPELLEALRKAYHPAVQLGGLLCPEGGTRRKAVDAIKLRTRTVHREACQWWRVLYELFQEAAGLAPEALPARLRAHGRELAEWRCGEALLGRVQWDTVGPGVGPHDLREAGLLGGFEGYPEPVRKAETQRRQRVALEGAVERWRELRAGALAGGAAALEALRTDRHPLALVVAGDPEVFVNRLGPILDAYPELEEPGVLFGVAPLVAIAGHEEALLRAALVAVGAFDEPSGNT